MNYEWVNIPSENFNDSILTNWKIKEGVHVWCDACGDSHPPTVNMLLEYGLMSLYVNFEKRR